MLVWQSFWNIYIYVDPVKINVLKVLRINYIFILVYVFKNRLYIYTGICFKMFVIHLVNRCLEVEFHNVLFKVHINSSIQFFFRSTGIHNWLGLSGPGSNFIGCHYKL